MAFNQSGIDHNLSVKMTLEKGLYITCSWCSRCKQGLHKIILGTTLDENNRRLSEFRRGRVGV